MMIKARRQCMALIVFLTPPGDSDQRGLLAVLRAEFARRHRNRSYPASRYGSCQSLLAHVCGLILQPGLLASRRIHTIELREHREVLCDLTLWVKEMRHVEINPG
jgi:hypothetical protein